MRWSTEPGSGMSMKKEAWSGRILLHIVLFLARRGQIAGIHAFHADENVGASRTARLGDEILDFPGENVHLHHELDDYFFFLAHVDQGVENCFPIFVAGKVVVSEKIELSAVGVIVVANGLDDSLGRTKAHLASLNIDDGAEGAFKRAAAAAVQRAGAWAHKLSQVFLADGGNRLVG